MSQVNQPETSQKPEKVFKSGAVFASVFQQSGAKGSFKVANVQRRFKSQDGQWKSAHNYTAKQLVHVIDVAKQALEYIGEHEGKEHAAQAEEKQAA